MKTSIKLLISVLTLGVSLTCTKTGQAELPPPGTNVFLEHAVATRIREQGALKLSFSEYQQIECAFKDQSKDTNLSPQDRLEAEKNAKMYRRSSLVLQMEAIKYPVIRYKKLYEINKNLKIDGLTPLTIPYWFYGFNEEKKAVECIPPGKCFNLAKPIAYLSLKHRGFYSAEKMAIKLGSNAPKPKVDDPTILHFPINTDNIITDHGVVFIPGGLIPAMVEINTFLAGEHKAFEELYEVIAQIKKALISFAIDNQIMVDGNRKYVFFEAAEIHFMDKEVAPNGKTDVQSLINAMKYISNASALIKSLYVKFPKVMEQLGAIDALLAMAIKLLKPQEESKSNKDDLKTKEIVEPSSSSSLISSNSAGSASSSSSATPMKIEDQLYDN